MKYEIILQKYINNTKYINNYLELGNKRLYYKIY